MSAPFSGQEQGKELVDKLYRNGGLTKEEFCELIKKRGKETERYARKLACQVREKVYGNQIYIRGLIEFTNYCKNDCYYCGIRKSNGNAQRYRLKQEDILECCEEGYSLGFRTFVLQGGEDGYFTAERMEKIIRTIKKRFPDCALTLSVGEKDEETYRVYREAGADRYLLRHETADEAHYRKLHPENLSLKHRKDCLWTLKKLGFQTGAGFMAGSPGQTEETLAEDFLFLRELQPEMVGIGPFIAHRDTPFRDEPDGTLEDTLFYLALTRLMMPRVLLPATTARGTGTGNTFRGQCGDAKSFARFSKEKVYALRWKNLYRRRGGRTSVRPGPPYGKDRMPDRNRPGRFQKRYPGGIRADAEKIKKEKRSSVNV